MPSVPVSVTGSAAKMTLHMNVNDTFSFCIQYEPQSCRSFARSMIWIMLGESPTVATHALSSSLIPLSLVHSISDDERSRMASVMSVLPYISLASTMVSTLDALTTNDLPSTGTKSIHNSSLDSRVIIMDFDASTATVLPVTYLYSPLPVRVNITPCRYAPSPISSDVSTIGDDTSVCAAFHSASTSASPDSLTIFHLASLMALFWNRKLNVSVLLPPTSIRLSSIPLMTTSERMSSISSTCPVM